MDDDKSTKLANSVNAILATAIPNCSDALRLVELGQSRPLNLRERFVLLYNTPLCLHCNCKREKFEKERAKLREIQATREA